MSGAGAPAARRPGRRGAKRTVIVATVVLLLSAAGYLLVGAGSYLVVTSEPASADVIVVTYGVLGRRGVESAAQLYEAGLAPRIVLSRFRQHPDLLTPEPSAYALQYLVDLGVPEKAGSVVPKHVTSLVEEARQLAVLAGQHGWSRLLVLAVDYRSRRTEGTLAKALGGTGARATVVVLRELQWRPDAWWQTRQGIDHVWNEYPRLAYYRLRGNL